MARIIKNEEDYLLALKADEARKAEAEERRKARIEATKERRRKYANVMELHQCIGDPETGAICPHTAVPGFALCILHGGDLTAAKRAAFLKFQALLDPSFEVLVKCLASSDEKTAFKAAEFVFAKAGFGPRVAIDLEDKPEDLSGLSTEALQIRAKDLLQRLSEKPEKEQKPDVEMSPSVH